MTQIKLPSNSKPKGKVKVSIHFEMEHNLDDILPSSDFSEFLKLNHPNIKPCDQDAINLAFVAWISGEMGYDDSYSWIWEADFMGEEALRSIDIEVSDVL